MVIKARKIASRERRQVERRREIFVERGKNPKVKETEKEKGPLRKMRERILISGREIRSAGSVVQKNTRSECPTVTAETKEN